MEAWNIRLAAPQDAEAISRIYAASWKKAYRGMVPQGFLEELSESHWTEAFRGWLEQGEVQAAIAYDGETPVGAIACCKAREELPMGGTLLDCGADYSRWGEVQSLYVLSEYFGRGVGQALLSYGLGTLLREFEAVFLWVLRENERAKAFYEKNGFRATTDQCICEVGGKSLTDLRYIWHKK